MTRTAVVLTLWALGLGACDGGGPDPSDMGSVDTGFGPDSGGMAGELEIGTAEANGSPDFVFFTEGATVSLARGGQGGFHVNLHVRFAEAPPFGVEFPGWVRRSVRRASNDDLVSRFEGSLFFVPDDERGLWTSTLPMQAFLCPPPVGVPVIDELMYVQIQVRNTDSPEGPLLYEGTTLMRPACPSGSTDVCRQVCDPN